MRYSDVTAKPKAAGLFRLELHHWASSYEKKPAMAVNLGIRLPSDADLSYARSIARERDEKQPGNEKRNLINATVAAVLCDPENAAEPHDLFQFPDDQILTALQPSTIQAIFDEVERLMVDTSPISPEATDEQIVSLMGALADGELDELQARDPGKAASARRYLNHCLDLLTPPDAR